MNLTKNFTMDELKCKHCGKCEMQFDLLNSLQTLRDLFGKPLRISSGYRCEEHNKAVGGAEDSQHTKGVAVDIDTSRMSASDKLNLLELITKVGFTGVGVAKTFFHVDTRKTEKSFWTY